MKNSGNYRKLDRSNSSRQANSPFLSGTADAVDEVRGVSGVVSRFRHDVVAAENGISLGLLKGAYHSAIEYSAIAVGMRGMILLAGIFAAGIAFWGGGFLMSIVPRTESIGIFEIVSTLVPFIFFFFGFYFFTKAVRLELFRPEDEPTVFDRKNRKVYRIYREVYAGWRGLVAPWPMKTAEYDWDLIDAEHHAAVTTTGSTISRQHGLIFIVRTSATDPTPVDSFAIGNSMLMGEVTVPAVWEHIRRFMEEDGPHLPPGEVLRQAKRPATFWQCMASTGPYGANFRIWWREQTALMILGLILFPIVFPLMTLLGVFSWLSYKTSIPIQWSPSVRAAIDA